MWQRLVQYLAKTKNPLQPDQFVIQTAERWAVSDKLGGRTVAINYGRLQSLRCISILLGGDPNGIYSLSAKLATAKKDGETFSSFNGTTKVKPSLIDHIFLQ